MEAGLERKYLRKRQVLGLTPFGATGLYERMAKGTFPKPVAYLSPVMPVWNAGEVLAAIERMVADARERGPQDAATKARKERAAKRPRKPAIPLGA